MHRRGMCARYAPEFAQLTHQRLRAVTSVERKSISRLRATVTLRRALSTFDLRPHRVGRRAGLAQRRHEVRELAEERTRVARVDDFLDPERLGRAERRAELVEAILDLHHLRLGIRGRVEVRTICRTDPRSERRSVR